MKDDPSANDSPFPRHSTLLGNRRHSPTASPSLRHKPGARISPGRQQTGLDDLRLAIF